MSKDQIDLLLMAAISIFMGVILTLPYTRSIANKISRVLISAYDWLLEKTLGK